MTPDRPAPPRAGAAQGGGGEAKRWWGTDDHVTCMGGPCLQAPPLAEPAEPRYSATRNPRSGTFMLVDRWEGRVMGPVAIEARAEPAERERHRPLLEEVRDWSNPEWLNGISSDLALFHIHGIVETVLATLPAAAGEPMAWLIETWVDGKLSTREASTNREHVEWCRSLPEFALTRWVVTPLSAAPRDGEVEALLWDVLSELADLVEAHLEGATTLDSFTTQPARRALAAAREPGEGA